jgi:hypothetical protein
VNETRDHPAELAPEDLGDIPFERLFEAMCSGGGLKVWNEVYGRIVARVRARIHDAEIAESAARSAVRTYLRRARGKSRGGASTTLQVDGREALLGHLVLIAFDKARQRLNGVRHEVQMSVLKEEGFEPVDPVPGEDALVAEAEADAARR